MAADGIPPMQNLILSAIGLIPPALLLLPLIQWRSEPALRKGIGYGFLTGIVGGLGNLALFAALSGGGKAAIVFPLTAIYPLITVIIAWSALRERLHGLQMIGIALAVACVVVFSMESGSSWSLLRGIQVAPWLGFSLIALLFWAFTGVTQKLSSRHVSAEVSVLGFTSAFLAIALALVATQKLSWNFPLRQYVLAMTGGALNSLGTLAGFMAFRQGGKAAVVTPLIALYPMLTVLLAVPILGEKVGLREGCGIILALAAGLALSAEKTSADSGN